MNEIDKLAQATNKGFERVYVLFGSVNKRIDTVDKRLGKVERRVDKVEEWVSKVDKRLGKVERRIDKVGEAVTSLQNTQTIIQDTITNLQKEMREREERIINEFRVIAENIHQDVAGANRDQILLILQKQENIEQRLSRVEEKVGV